MAQTNFLARLSVFVILLAVIILSLSIAGRKPAPQSQTPTALRYLPPSPAPQSTLPLPTFSPGETGQINPPPLPSQFNWQPVASPAYDGYVIYWNANPPVKYLPITPAGKAYSTSRDTSSSPVTSLLDDFNQKYFKNLEQLGWQHSIDFGPYHISGTTADGPVGSIYGLIKRSGFIIRTVAYQWSFHSADSQVLESGGSTPICPCSDTLEVFFGDPIDLRDYLPL